MKTSQIATYLRDERGAVTVDWATLGAGAIGLSLATAGLLTGAFNTVISHVDGELRSQQTNDGFIKFTSSHFEPLYNRNAVHSSTAEELFNMANSMLNHDVIAALQSGIEQLESGRLNTAEIGALVAVASVAWQRNIVPDNVLDYYFGFNGNPTPRVASAL